MQLIIIIIIGKINIEILDVYIALWKLLHLVKGQGDTIPIVSGYWHTITANRLVRWG